MVRNMRALITAKVDSHIYNFHLELINALSSRGYEVDVASFGDQQFDNVKNKFNIDFGKNPFTLKNLKNFSKMRKIIRDNNYEVVHANTAVAGVITRLACWGFKQKPQVIYMAHGFHFLKKGSIKNWIVYYPIEKICSKLTDDLILINSEDYNLARIKMKAKRIHLINGVGVKDIFYETPICPELVFPKYNLDKRKKYLTYVAELNDNKNQMFLLSCVPDIVALDNNIHFLMIGDGQNFLKMSEYIKKNNLKDFVTLMGHQENIFELLSISTCALSTSFREGLAVNLMESMAMGLPIVATKTRGVSDLVIDNVNGHLVNLDRTEFVDAVVDVLSNEDKAIKFGQEGKSLSQQYRKDIVVKNIVDIYERNN